MKLILLGTAGYHPNDTRQTACLMLPEIGVVLDAGTAFYRVRDHLATRRLDVFVSHAHLDHVIGLTYLFDVLADRKPERVRVHGQQEKLDAIDQLLFAEPLFPVRPPVDLVPLAERVPVDQDGVLTHFPLDHPGGAVAYRIDWPQRSLAYVTDTTATTAAPYADFIRGVDLLVHECHFPDGQEQQARLTGHSCVSAVAKLAAATAVGQLVLVHINPAATNDDPVGIEQARSIFANAVIGADRMEFHF